MSDIERAKLLFKKSGLAFPHLPAKLASNLREHGEWLYSTRNLDVSPYELKYFLEEAVKRPVEDYAILAHSGHGVNSYAIQYYLICGSLRIFLYIGWGGIYMNSRKAKGLIRDCFALADGITNTAQVKLQTNDLLTVVASDSYGGCWATNHAIDMAKLSVRKLPQEVLVEAQKWLNDKPPPMSGIH
ncbi:MAG TPA: hypothetical protein PJ991_06765 [Kiritimatiellia bacterium]|nr:hypothetical protein [Kiritimatiellia bacterium]